MLTAISMYLGGEIVSADACDYESSRDLGLKCSPCEDLDRKLPLIFRGELTSNTCWV